MTHATDAIVSQAEQILEEKQKADLQQGLAQFHGSETFYQHPFGLIYTEGIHYLAEHAGAYWLLDLVASYQVHQKVKHERVQVYDLTVKRTHGLVVITDGNDNELARQDIPYTDFPLEHIRIYCIDNVILLPTEY